VTVAQEAAALRAIHVRRARCAGTGERKREWEEDWGEGEGGRLRSFILLVSGQGLKIKSAAAAVRAE
jgi:hypothetical protein